MVALSARRARLAAGFRAKTLLYRYVPGGYGYVRRLRAAEDPAYVHARDRHPVRRKHDRDRGWQETVDEHGVRRREYATYDEYVTHQSLKFDEILKTGGAFPNSAIAAWRRKYYRRFRHLIGLLPQDALIVCAGARQGTEVETLRDLGFHRAYGIDLNPGADNPLVREGDFHALPEADGTVDLVYSNSLDHVFDFDRFFGDHARALKPAGYALYDLSLVTTEAPAPFESVAWEREDVIFERALEHFDRVVHVETESGWKWMLLQGTRR